MCTRDRLLGEERCTQTQTITHGNSVLVPCTAHGMGCQVFHLPFTPPARPCHSGPCGKQEGYMKDLAPSARAASFSGASRHIAQSDAACHVVHVPLAFTLGVLPNHWPCCPGADKRWLLSARNLAAGSCAMFVCTWSTWPSAFLATLRSSCGHTMDDVAVMAHVYVCTDRCACL